MQKNKASFKKIYIIFLASLLAIMAVCLIYVGSVLADFESSQPENVAIAEFEKMQKAAKKGKLDSFLTDYTDGILSPEDIAKAESDISSAKGKLSSKLLKSEEGGALLSYAVFAGENRVGEVVLRSDGNNRTMLAILTVNGWDVEFISPAKYSYNMTLPASMTVLLNGEKVDGTDSGGNKAYSFASYVDKPDVTVRDSFGREIKYDGISRLDITKYTVQIPSNYKIISADGMYTVPVELAFLEDVSEYKYVAQNTEMPKMATYNLGIFDDMKFGITDNLGNPVNYTLDGHALKITEQASLDEIPDGTYSAEDILANAKTWSLFMTADLGGAKHGYGQVEKFLLPDSYLMDVAYKWATGVDITFTSVHTLDNPPFSEENVSGYVKYSDECFSADVKLVKMMHLNSGADVADTMNCRFFYVQKDGTWYVADIQEIID